jgi:hypothetical protein
VRLEPVYQFFYRRKTNMSTQQIIDNSIERTTALYQKFANDLTAQLYAPLLAATAVLSAPPTTSGPTATQRAVEAACAKNGMKPPPRGSYPEISAPATLNWTVQQTQQIAGQPTPQVAPAPAATPAPSALDIAGLSVEKIAINVESSRSSLESARTGLRNAPPERLAARISDLERATQAADVLLSAIIKRAEAGVAVGAGEKLDDAHQLAACMWPLESASREADGELMAARHRS